MLLNQFHDILPGSCIKQVEIYLCGSLCGLLSKLPRMNLKTEISPAILDLCLRKTLSGKSRDYQRDAIFFEKPV